MAYEAAAAFEPCLRGIKRGPGPLLAFGAFDGPREPPAREPPAPASLTPPEPAVARGAVGWFDGRAG